MAHPRLLIALSLLWGCQPSEVVGYSEFDPDVPLPALYEVKEWTFEYHGPLDNPFTHYIQVEVRRENENEPYQIEGFYAGRDGNGDHIWKARFMPTETGAWHYKWTVGDESGGDVLDVQARRDPLNHGHVHVENAPRPVLRHDDGTVHYWFGGKAFTARNYGQPAKDGQQNRSEQSGHDTYYTDEEFKGYLDLMQETGHNGTRLKIALYPLEDDGLTWDLAWIDRAERWIRWMQERHIYCQITFFDPASRAKMKWFESSNDPDYHPLNAWQDDRAEEEAKRNYIRYIVARFAAYSNVYWELVERVDAFGPKADNCFVELANRDYVSWLRSYDPYDLPIGASAEATPGRIKQIDIEFSRDHNTLLTSYSDRAIVLNEVADTCGGTLAQYDATIRNETNRQCYRAALWRAFVSGAFGANEASWLDLTQTLDEAVQNVMRDQARLREIVEDLPVGLGELSYAEGFVESTSPRVGTRSKDGELYVAYFPPDYPAGAIKVRLPPGAYTACWLNPKAPDPPGTNPGAIPNQPGPLLTEGGPTEFNVEPDSDSASLGRPGFNGDLVLLVERSDGTSDRSCLTVGSASNPG